MQRKYLLIASQTLRTPLLGVLPLCCLQFAMLLAIDFPDAAGDAFVGKRTLVVRLGGDRAARLLVLMLLAAYAGLPLLLLLGATCARGCRRCGDDAARCLAGLAGVARRLGRRSPLEQPGIPGYRPAHGHGHGRATGLPARFDRELTRMETITTIATAVPPYPMTCAAVKQAVQQIFQLKAHTHGAVMALFDHAQVARRYSVLPLDELIRERSLTQTNMDYQVHAIALGRKVAADCLS